MPSECDDFFSEASVPFDPAYQDEAVSAVYHADFYDPPYKKWLIICWFQTTYQEWNGTAFNTRPASQAMSSYLKTKKRATFEDILNDTEPQNDKAA